jgi:predicted GNAT family acetyltransferase
MEDLKDFEFLDNKEKNQFELHINNQISVIEYQIKGNRFVLLHTAVPEALQGRGIAKILVEKSLQVIDSYGMKIMPLCPYIVNYLNKNPAWDHLWK